MQQFGRDYSLQIVKNAKVLAQALCNFGFNVLGEKRGFTETHQVVVNLGEPGAGGEAASALEKANIILNKNIIPGDGINPRNPRGIRIGVQEMTTDAAGIAGVWVGGADAQYSILAPAFDQTAANWSAAGPETLLVAGIGTALGKLTPAVASSTAYANQYSQYISRAAAG